MITSSSFFSFVVSVSLSVSMSVSVGILMVVVASALVLVVLSVGWYVVWIVGALRELALVAIAGSEVDFLV